MIKVDFIGVEGTAMEIWHDALNSDQYHQRYLIGFKDGSAPLVYFTKTLEGVDQTSEAAIKKVAQKLLLLG